MTVSPAISVRPLEHCHHTGRFLITQEAAAIFRKADPGPLDLALAGLAPLVGMDLDDRPAGGRTRDDGAPEVGRDAARRLTATTTTTTAKTAACQGIAELKDSIKTLADTDARVAELRERHSARVFAGSNGAPSSINACT